MKPGTVQEVVNVVENASILNTSTSEVGTRFDEKRLAEQQASLELKEAQAKIMVEVANQYRRLLEARKELEVADLSQSAAAELLRVARNRYSVREVLLSDVLKVQSRRADADHRLTQARLDLATAQADFEKALGEEQ